jgi:Zn-finger nucleic acid-binding protein
MPRCPVCESRRLVIAVRARDRHGYCVQCDATWVEDGMLQRNVKRPTARLRQPLQYARAVGA